MKSLLLPEAFHVVIPCYNCGEYIEECLAPLQAQTFANGTALVADDTAGRGRPDLEEKRSPCARSQRTCPRPRARPS